MYVMGCFSDRPLFDYTYTGKVKQKAKDSDDEEEDDEEVNYQYTRGDFGKGIKVI